MCVLLDIDSTHSITAAEWIGSVPVHISVNKFFSLYEWRMQTLKIAYTNSSLARIPLESIILFRLDKRVSPLIKTMSIEKQYRRFSSKN